MGDVFMTSSRGVQFAADFLENGSVDLCTSMAPHFLLLSPADLIPVESILKARRKFQDSFQQSRITIAVAANDVMDFPGATHPNLSVHSLANLLAALKAMPSSMVYRVKTAETDASKSMVDEIASIEDSGRLASLLTDAKVLRASELDSVGNVDSSSHVVLYLFEDVVGPWSMTILESLVTMLGQKYE